MAASYIFFVEPHSRNTMTVTNIHHENDSNLDTGTPLPQQTDSAVLNIVPPATSQEPSNRNQSYENVPNFPKPPTVRHSHVEIQECPAYKLTKCSSGDYDDVRSTAVRMQPNPSYKHANPCYNHVILNCYKK